MVGLTGVCGTVTMITVHNTGTVVMIDHDGIERTGMPLAASAIFEMRFTGWLLHVKQLT